MPKRVTDNDHADRPAKKRFNWVRPGRQEKLQRMRKAFPKSKARSKTSKYAPRGFSYMGTTVTRKRIQNANNRLEHYAYQRGDVIELEPHHIEKNLCVGCITCGMNLNFVGGGSHDRIDIGTRDAPGRYTPTNTVPMCKLCNYMRHTATMQEWWNRISTIFLFYNHLVDAHNGNFEAAIRYEYQRRLDLIVEPPTDDEATDDSVTDAVNDDTAAAEGHELDNEALFRWADQVLHSFAVYDNVNDQMNLLTDIAALNIDE